MDAKWFAEDREEESVELKKELVEGNIGLNYPREERLRFTALEEPLERPLMPDWDTRYQQRCVLTYPEHAEMPPPEEEGWEYDWTTVTEGVEMLPELVYTSLQYMKSDWFSPDLHQYYRVQNEEEK